LKLLGCSKKENKMEWGEFVSRTGIITIIAKCRSGIWKNLFMVGKPEGKKSL
jgi:hypothetical protein